jgi:hypothetical protein
MVGGMKMADVDMKNEEEKKIDMSGKNNQHLGGGMMMQGQREYEIMESFRKQEEYEKCIVCKKSFSKEDEVIGNKLIIWSTDCMHMTHKKCFLAHLFQLAKKSLDITCPKDDCKKLVSEQEFNMYLGDQREEYDKIILANFMKENPDLVRCNCGNIMYVEQGKIDMN